MCVEDRVTAGNASEEECWNGHTKGRWGHRSLKLNASEHKRLQVQSLFNLRHIKQPKPRIKDEIMYFTGLLRKSVAFLFN